MTRLLVAALLTLGEGSVAAQPFTGVTGDPIVGELRYSEGASWGDINGDGHLDAFVPDLYTDTNRLFVNNGDGTFSEVETGPVVTDASRSPGGTFGDFDNDGDLDLFVAAYFGDSGLLYQNAGDGTFANVTAGDIATGGGWSFGSSTADVDNDGFLDLYVTNIGKTDDGEVNHLYRNQGNGTFSRVTEGPAVTDRAASAGSSWADVDGDGDLDLFVANGGTFTPVLAEHDFYQNDGTGTLTRIPAATIGIAPSWGSVGTWADIDNDGDLDLFVPNYGGDDNMLYTNDGDGTFTRVTTGVLVTDGGDSVSAAWGDYDNDGDLDVYVTNDFNEDNDLYQNNGDGTFAKITDGPLVADGGRSNGASWIDVDSDGDLDLFVPNGQRPIHQSNRLYRNDRTGNGWLNLVCVGTTSNRSAIGATVRVKAEIGGVPTWQLRQIAGGSGFNAQESLNVEFGLGDAARVDSMIVRWPSGLTETSTDIAPNTFYLATEGGGFHPVGVAEPPSRDPVGALAPNQPNPFGRSTTISYTIGAPGHVTLAIFDPLGRQLVTLVDGPQPAGLQTVTWDARDERGQPVASGVYLYRLRLGGETWTRAMVVAR